MAIFESKKAFKTASGNEIKIIAYVGSGKRHNVYSVDYKGQTKALVWLKDEAAQKDIIKEKLVKHIDMCSPNTAFLWPTELVEDEEGVGYITEFRPEEYKSVAEILESDIRFSSSVKVVDACMRITNAINSLHEQGLCYQDICTKNVFIEPKSGDVLINYLDNVASVGDSAGGGTLGFAAPELFTPNGRALGVYTDTYALSVLIFVTLFRYHPLEGTRYLQPFLTEEITKDLYVFNPLFIFDEADTSNSPSPYVQKALIGTWMNMPFYVQSFFKSVFSSESFSDPESRPDVKDWLNLLSRLRNDVIKCNRCGNELVVKNKPSTYCRKCGAEVVVKAPAAVKETVQTSEDVVSQDEVKSNSQVNGEATHDVNVNAEVSSNVPAVDSDALSGELVANAEADSDVSAVDVNASDANEAVKEEISANAASSENGIVDSDISIQNDDSAKMPTEEEVKVVPYCGKCGSKDIVKKIFVQCKKCGNAVNTDYILALPEYSVIISRETRIYKCMLGKFDSKEAMEPALIVITKPDAPNVFGLQNVSKEVIKARTASNVEKEVKPQEYIPVMDGITLSFNNVNVSIKKKG